MYPDATSFDPEAPAESRWPAILAWTLLLLAALAVMEFTAHPAVGVIIGCSKFGWDDFRSAVWLRRADPHRLRGRVCSWFCIATGFWKIAFTSLPVFMLIMILIGIVEANRAAAQNNPAEPTAALVGIMIAAAGSFTLAGLVSCYAFAQACRRGVRVWIDGSVGAARRSRSWPPTGRSLNLAGVLLVSALVPAAFIAFAVSAAGVVGALLPAVHRAFAGKPPQHVVLASIAVPLAVLGLTILLSVSWIRNVIARRAIAVTPAQCWLAPPPDEPDPFGMPMGA